MKWLIELGKGLLKSSYCVGKGVLQGFFVLFALLLLNNYGVYFGYVGSISIVFMNIFGVIGYSWLQYSKVENG